MRKLFLSNLALLLAVNLVVKPFWILGIDRSVQNILGFETYGVYANLFTFSLILSVILDLGINNFTSTTIARDHTQVGRIFMPLMMVKLIFGLIYLLLTFAAGIIYGFGHEAIWLLLVLSFNQVLAYLSTYLRSNLQGLQLFRLDAWISAIDRLAMSLLGIGVVWLHWGGVSLQSFIYLQTGGYLAAVVVSAAFLLPRIRHLSFEFGPGETKNVIRKALPYGTLALLMMCYTRIDTLLIKKLSADGDLENGVYAAGGRLFDAANMISVMVAGMLLPLFSSLLGKREDIGKMVRLAMLLLLVPGILAAGFTWFYKQEIIMMLYPAADEYTADVFGYQMLSFMMLCGMYVFGTLLTAHNDLRLLNRLALVALLLNLFFNIFMIPRYGALGAAMVALGTHTFICISNVWFALRRIDTGIRPSLPLAYFLFACFVFVVVCILHHHLSAGWLMTLVITSVLSVPFLLIFRVVDVRSLMKQLEGLKRRI